MDISFLNKKNGAISVAKKGFLGRLRILSRSTGSPHWRKALKAVLMMVVAILIAKFLGLDKGIQAIAILTLLTTFITDTSLPLRKASIMAVVWLFMVILAFISASLALISLPLFIFFTVLWAFFGISLYIFGETLGYFGFLIFASYFLAVVIVNNQSSTPEWVFYCVIAFLVASILFIPQIWGRKENLRKMVASGFMPPQSLKSILAIRQALTSIPLNSRLFQLFRIGIYLTAFRGYSKLLMTRLSDESQERFNQFLETSNEISSQIAGRIITSQGKLDLEKLDQELSEIDLEWENTKERNSNALIDTAHHIRELLDKANTLLDSKEESKEKLKISSQQTSLREVLGANFNLENMYIRHALRFSLAMTIALLAVYLTHSRDAIWVAMGVLIIIKPDITSTKNNMILRVPLNLLAIIIAIILGFVFPHETLIWLAFIMLFFFRAFLPNYMSLSVIALTVFVVLIWPTGTVFDNAVARLVDISVGAFISLIFAYVILPSRVTINLPGQLAKTIRASNEYMQTILLAHSQNYNHETASKSFRNYMLEDSNLEAGLRKVQDTFKDISEDVEIYQEIAAANNKLTADLTAIATVLEEDLKSVPDLSHANLKVKEALKNLSDAIDQGAGALDSSLDKNSFNLEGESYIVKNLEHYLTWIISDLELLQEGVKTAAETGLLQRYRNLT